MDINNMAFQAYLKLKDSDLDDKNARDMALRDLQRSLDYCSKANENKNWLLQQAYESGMKNFKLIARVNTSGLELMEWCDDAQNFDGMCGNIKVIATYKDGDYVKRLYSLEELPKVIDNALSWYNSVRSNHHKFNSTGLHILGVN